MEKIVKNLWLALSFLAALFYGCSQEEDVMVAEDNVVQNVPCYITVDLNGGGNSRLALELNGLNLKSTWSEGDQFEVWKEDVSYTFTLDEGAGTSVGVFKSETTPPTYAIDSELAKNFNYDVYYPSKNDYEQISFHNQLQDGDGNMEHLKNKITMKHHVGYYTDIRFIETDYSTDVTFSGSSSIYTIGTVGSNLHKNLILKIDASNLPINFKPISLSLESFHESGNSIVPFLDNNAQTSYTSNDNKVSMTLQNFDEDKDFVVYMAQSVHDKTFSDGSIVRLTVKDANGETYYSDKVFNEERTIEGGKMLTLVYNSGWKKGNNTTYQSSDTSKDGKTKSLQQHNQGNGIKVVFMGDGFSDRQIADGTYEAVMKKGMEAFFSEQPFTYYQNYFDVDMVYAVSTQEGCKDDAAQETPNNTAFSTWFGEGTEVSGDTEKCKTYAKYVDGIDDNNIKNTLIIVMMNSTKYAGTCHSQLTTYNDPNNQNIKDYGEGVSVAYFPIGTTDAALARVLTHEANGHGFGKLADEYYYNSYYEPGDYLNSLYATHQTQNTYGWYLNVSTTGEKTQVYWNNFIGDETYASEKIGVYEGANTYLKYWWRPTENSIMNQNVGGFNAPSRKIIYYRINKLALGDTWTYDHTAFKALDVNWIPTPVSTLSVRSVGCVQQEFIPLGRPVVTVVDEFGNIIEQRK